jgi:hypothetical protein
MGIMANISRRFALLPHVSMPNTPIWRLYRLVSTSSVAPAAAALEAAAAAAMVLGSFRVMLDRALYRHSQGSSPRASL